MSPFMFLLLASLFVSENKNINFEEFSMNELKSGQPILPSFHLTCFGCAHSSDMYYDFNSGSIISRCQKQGNKPISAVYPTIDCEQFTAEE